MNIKPNNAWLFFVLLYACNVQDNSPIFKPAVFHYNQPNLINSLDPAFAKSQNNIWAIEHLYNQLVDLDDSMKIIPELATSWEILQNGNLYRFHIRNDVYFHIDSCFGIPLTRKLIASDVVYSFKRLIDDQLSAPGSWIFKTKVIADEPFRSVGDSIFEIHLLSPFAPLLQLLTSAYCSVYPPEAINIYGNQFSKHPVGTSAFRLRKWIGRKGLFLERNPAYYAKAPNLDGIRISFMEDRNTAYLEFLKNQLDFFSGIHTGFAHQILNSRGYLREDQEGKFQLLKGDYLNTEYIGINTSKLDPSHPLHMKAFRQALNYAIDRKKLVENFRFGIGTPALSGFIPKGLPAYDPIQNPGYSYDPEKAKQLFAQCGFSDIQNIPELVISTNKDYVDLMTFIAKQWQEIGLDVSIDLVETASLREQMRSGDVSIFRASWIADYPDEESFMTVFYGPNTAPPNYTRFNDPLFNKIYETAISEINPDKRRKYYQQLDAILIEHAPVIVLFYDQTAWFAQNHIRNLKTNPLNLLKLNETSETY
ncbi:MAG: ABC transporter substrate-binding protein [Saprospiraceae bacterium]|nr:ABC transporter substrate-binding protein [Saprospiraceae bacterium]